MKIEERKGQEYEQRKLKCEEECSDKDEELLKIIKAEIKKKEKENKTIKKQEK